MATDSGQSPRSMYATSVSATLRVALPTKPRGVLTRSGLKCVPAVSLVAIALFRIREWLTFSTGPGPDQSKTLVGCIVS